MDDTMSLLQIIDSNGQLERILHQIHCQSSKKCDIYIIRVKLSVHHIMNLAPKLGSLVLLNQRSIIKIMKEIVISAIEALHLGASVSLDRIIPDIEFCDVPMVKECALQPKCSQYGSLTFCDGLVVGVSPLQPYVSCRLLFCTDEMCRGHSGKRKFAYQISQSFNNQKICLESQTCQHCGMRMSENIQYQCISNYFAFTVLLCGNIFTNQYTTNYGNNYSLSAHRTCFAMGKFETEIRIGRKYRLIGRRSLLCIGNSLLDVFEVNHVEALELLKPVWMQKNEYWSRFISSMPQQIMSVDYGIGLTMAFMFCNDVSPSGTYFLLKLMLLLFLVSEDDPSYGSERNILNSNISSESVGCRSHEHIGKSFLVVSRENSLVHRLLLSAGKFSNNFQIHSALKSIVGTCWEKRDLVEQFVGGTLLLASGGTAYIPHLDNLPSKDVSSLIKALECNEAVIPSTNKESASYRQQITCTLWSYMNSVGLVQPKVSLNSSHNIYSQSQSCSQYVEMPALQDETVPLVRRIQNKSLRKLANSLDLVYMSDVVNETDCVYNQTSYHLLNLNIGNQPDDEINFTTQLYSEYIQNSRNTEVTIADDSEALLKSYYLAGRKASSFSEWVMPQSALKTLLFLGKSFSKLCGKYVMTTSHALLAIYLYEISLKNRIGTCNLKMQVFHHVDCVDNNLLDQFSGEMSSIYHQVMEFISLYETEKNNSEE